MLPLHNSIAREVPHICETIFTSRLQQYPSDVRVKKALVRVVGIEVRIGVTVMRAVAAGPPLDGTLYGTCTEDGEGVFERLGCVVGAVSPEAVVARRDTCGRTNLNCGAPDDKL